MRVRGDRGIASSKHSPCLSQVIDNWLLLKREEVVGRHLTVHVSSITSTFFVCLLGIVQNQITEIYL